MLRINYSKFTKSSIKEIVNHFKLQNYKEEDINKIISNMEYLFRFGARKPCLTVKEYNKKVNEKLQNLDNKQISNAYLVKVSSSKEYSWKQISNKVNYLLRNLEDWLDEFEYYIFANCISENNFEMNFCFDFVDSRINENHLQEAFKEFWYSLCDLNIKQIDNINELKQTLEKQIIKNQESSFTFYPKRAKIFKHTDCFGNNLNKIINPRLVLASYQEHVRLSYAENYDEYCKFLQESYKEIANS